MSDESVGQPVDAVASEQQQQQPELSAQQVLEQAIAQSEAAPAAEAEVKPEEQKQPEPQQPQDDKFAAKFAALSRREKEIRRREVEAEKKLKDVEARLKQMEEQFGPLKSLDEKIKSDPLGLLKERANLDEKALIEKYILKGEETPEQKQQSALQALQQKIEQLEAKLAKEAEEAKKNAEEQEKAKQEKLKSDYLAHLNGFVQKNADDYELIRANDAVNVIYEVMEQHYNESGKVLSEKEAADLVENYLLDEAKKLMELKKIKGQLAPQKTSEPVKSPGQSVTLSNAVAQQAPNRIERTLSDDESKAEAAKLLRWIE